MKDENYFDGKMFVFTNDELKKALQEQAISQNKPLYLIVDEALRDKVNENVIIFERTPKVPVMQ